MKNQKTQNQTGQGNVHVKTNGYARFRRVAWERVTKIDDLLRAGKYPKAIAERRTAEELVRRYEG